MIDEIKVYNIKGEYLGTFDELFSIDEEEEETQISSFLFAKITSPIMNKIIQEVYYNEDLT